MKHWQRQQKSTSYRRKKNPSCKKALDAANKIITELKAKFVSLTKELSEYKSIRGKLHTAGLEQENEALRGKLRAMKWSLNTTICGLISTDTERKRLKGTMLCNSRVELEKHTFSNGNVQIIQHII